MCSLHLLFFLLIFPSLLFLEKETVVLKQYQDMGKGALGVASAFDIFPSPIFFSEKEKRGTLAPENKMSSTRLCGICSLFSSSPCMNFSALPWFAQWVV